jgi:hypothetical protein
LFPPDKDSDPEEEEQHLPPPSSLTQVAARIRDHVSKYLDDQAEDSDEEAEEEHEGDEQEMKEDRGTHCQSSFFFRYGLTDRGFQIL